MTEQLTLHRGARIVAEGELEEILAPEATDTWFPLAHWTVLERVRNTLGEAGYEVSKTQLALSSDNHRFFGTLDLHTTVHEGVALMIGIRNSTDQTMPIGFSAGERVFVCDNGAFSSEIIIARKHTRHGERRFNDALSRAVLGLRQYEAVAQARIQAMQDKSLDDHTANSLLLQAAETEIVSWRTLPKVIHEWRNPRHDDFAGRTVWSLFNAFTEVLKDRQRTQPARAAYETIQLQELLTKKEVIDVEFTKAEPALAG